MSDSYSYYSSRCRYTVGGRHSRRGDKDLISGIRKQNYEEIKEQLLNEEALFEDPEFPAEDSSIFYSREPPRAFEWKRPHVSRLEKLHIHVHIHMIMYMCIQIIHKWTCNALHTMTHSGINLLQCSSRLSFVNTLWVRTTCIGLCIYE